MKRDYRHVSPMTAMDYAHKADFLNREEVARAKVTDAAEPESWKRWRSILIRNNSIRNNIFDIHRALYDMGATLTARGERAVQSWIKQNGRWYDPAPNVSLTNALKKLTNCIADKRTLWVQLRAAEKREQNYGH